MLEPEDIYTKLKDAGYRMHPDMKDNLERSFRILPQMIVEAEVDEMARVVDESPYSEQAYLVEDKEHRAAVLLMQDAKGRYQIDHVVLALEADFSDIVFLLEEVLHGHDKAGYVLVE